MMGIGLGEVVLIVIILFIVLAGIIGMAALVHFIARGPGGKPD